MNCPIYKPDQNTFANILTKKRLLLSTTGTTPVYQAVKNLQIHSYMYKDTYFTSIEGMNGGGKLNEPMVVLHQKDSVCLGIAIRLMRRSFAEVHMYYVCLNSIRPVQVATRTTVGLRLITGSRIGHSSV